MTGRNSYCVGETTALLVACFVKVLLLARFDYTTFCGVPALKPLKFATAIPIKRRRVSTGAQAICGVK